jgi:hypothetical protein
MKFTAPSRSSFLNLTSEAWQISTRDRIIMKDKNVFKEVKNEMRVVEFLFTANNTISTFSAEDATGI